jgi:hypothetical protein
MVHEQKGSRGSTAAECLSERTLDHIDAMHGVIAFGDAATASSVHADRMHLVIWRKTAFGFCRQRYE